MSGGDDIPESLGPGVHRYRARRATADLVRALENSGRSARVVDLRGMEGKSGLIDALADGLAFPTWVGRNWDALDDALRDLGWWPAGVAGRAIVLVGANRVASRSPRDWETLLDVLTTAAERWSATDAPLLVLTRGG
jgi:hypothetical protein